MTSLSGAVERRGTTVIAIHGVGRHRPNEIQRAIVAVLNDPSVEVKEFNWDASVTQPTGENLASFLTNTSSDFVNTTNLHFEQPLAGWFFSEQALAFHNRCFVTAQWLLATAFVSILMLPVVFVVGPLMATLATDLEWQYFEGVFRLIVGAIRYVLVAALALLAVQLVLGVVHGVRASLVVCRRIVFLLLYQPLLIATGLLSINAIAIAPLGTILALAWVPAALTHFDSGARLSSRLGGWVYPLGALGFLVGTLIVAGLLKHAAQLWASPFKVSLDIVRYLGNPPYRRDIQRDLARMIAEASDGDRHIVIAAHSLGSIIAIDALVNGDAVLSKDSVTLLTAGSPLRRSFIRFFPGVFFPASLADIESAIRRRVASFAWINIYRPLDYVGGDLGLSRSGVGRDVSSRQWSRVITSHSGYWGDAVIIRMIRDAINDLQAPKSDPPRDVVYAAEVTYAGVNRNGLSGFIGPLAAGVGLLLLAGNSAMFLAAKRAQDVVVRAQLARVDSMGVIVSARVTHWMETSGGGDGGPQIERNNYRFEFTTKDGAPQTVALKTDSYIQFERSHRQMNADSLRTFIRSNCEQPAGKPRWFRSDLEYPCRRAGIRVKYLPEQPSYLVVPDFPPTASQWGSALDWVTQGWALLWATLFSAAAVNYLAVPLLKSLLGQNMVHK